jgi:K+-transporting ATPase ATPase C chain
MVLVFTVLLGLVYPLAVTGFAQGVFKDKANGSLVERDGKVVGSRWIGQNFTEAKYFHPRPSADDYVPGAQGGGTYSYGSNYGPTDARLIGNVPGVSITDETNPYASPDDPYCVPVQSIDKDENPITDDAGNAVYDKNKDGTYVCDPNTFPQRVLAYRSENGLGADVKVPVDAVTASGSGLDPAISVANARLQAPRVAEARNLPVDTVLAQVDAHTDGRGLGFLGEEAVNVLELNLALDDLHA